MPSPLLSRGEGTCSSSEAPAISVRNFSKTFSGRTVLRSVDLDVLPGEVHGLVGQNGSGKSTFIKILAGYHSPDPGAALDVRGETVSLPLDPGDPRSLGMSFVHQDLGLAETMSVVDNLRVGRYETGFAWRIPWRRERARVAAALTRFGLSVSPDTQISDLRDVERATVAILRAVDQLTVDEGVQQGLLVLDEPTAYLPRDGVDRLFATIREAAAMGVGVLFVTHRLEEVQALTDRVSILRDGNLVETAATAALSERELIQRILGRTLEELYPGSHDPQRDLALSAQNVSGPVVQDFSLDVARGEVVGLTGLLGMGHDHVLYHLFGAERALGGSISLDGKTHDLRDMYPRKAMAAGIALLPGNRQRDGSAPPATVTENVTLATVRSYFLHGVLRRRRERRDVQKVLTKFDVQPPEPGRTFATLSGGNQQKALVGKWFQIEPSVLLLHEPTQGVDIGARGQIFGHIQDAAKAGMSLILASTEHEDLAHLCDRVIIFRNGAAVAELQGDSLTHERIVEQCFLDERRPSEASGDSVSSSSEGRAPQSDGVLPTE